jgi:hypothetical protein
MLVFLFGFCACSSRRARPFPATFELRHDFAAAAGEIKHKRRACREDPQISGIQKCSSVAALLQPLPSPDLLELTTLRREDPK